VGNRHPLRWERYALRRDTRDEQQGAGLPLVDETPRDGTDAPLTTPARRSVATGAVALETADVMVTVHASQRRRTAGSSTPDGALAVVDEARSCSSRRG
jgi:hypothetical protein